MFHHLFLPHSSPVIRAQLLSGEETSPYFVWENKTRGEDEEGEGTEEEKGVCVGGPIKDLLWDPRGERVIVVFEDDHQSGERNSKGKEEEGEIVSEVGGDKKNQTKSSELLAVYCGL